MNQQTRDSLEKARERLFHENQAKLPEEDRYAERADEFCFAEHDGYKCTKKRGHSGQHIAHGILGYASERWSDDS